MSVGVEAIERRASVRLLKRAMACADFRSFRDELSRARLRKIGINVNNDPVFPDLAFSLPEPDPDTTRSSERPTVGIGLFNYRNSGAAGGEDLAEFSAYVAQICALVRWVIANNFAVQILIGDGSYDEKVHAAVRHQLIGQTGALDQTTFADEPATSYQEVCAQINRCAYVIASRFHNVLLALFLRCPTISISYEEKNDELMTSFGFQTFCQPITDLRLDTVVDQFQKLRGCDQAYRARAGEQADKNRAQLDDQYAALVRLIDPARSRSTEIDAPLQNVGRADRS